MAIAKYSGSSTVSKTLNIAYQIDDNKQETKNSELPIFQNQLEIKGLESGNVKVKNNGEGMIFARILLEGTPLAGNESAEESKLNLSVSYKSLNGTFIDVAKN